MSPRSAQTKLKAERVQSKLSKRAIGERLTALSGWSGRDRRTAITKTYRFPGFRAALSFVAFVGELAEAEDHHPDIDIRYSRVTLTLSTHEAGGLTDKDFHLASLIDQL